jgi:predicted aldo/keto reductase-like oxidoreductase
MSKEKGISRREFLAASGTLGAASVAAVKGVFAQDQATAEKKPESMRVPVRPFGKTGTNISCLGLGGMFDISSNQLMLKQCLKWGVTYWDTADCYEGGNSEKGIGQFFKKYPETRKDVFLVTKSDSREPDGMSKLLDQSLERMSTSYADLYFIHGIDRISEINDATRAWAEKAKSEGKIKFFGFSAHSNMEDLLVAAANLGWIDGIMMTYNFRLMHTDKMKAAVEACRKAGIGLTAMKSQGGGSVRMDTEAELEMAGRFVSQGFNDKQAKLKAIWENPHIASICSQMPNMTILMANIAAALNQAKLSGADIKFFEEYAGATSTSYCAGCRSICESCFSGNLPIADIMRYLMYYHSYGDCSRARSLFSELSPHVRNALPKLDYSQAENKCPRGIKIGNLMKEAVHVLA